MNLTEIQKMIAALYDGAEAAPDTTSDDWKIRTVLANEGIRRWDSNKGMLWDELWTELDDASDGTKTIGAGTTEYDCPSDFRFPGGFVELWDGSSRMQKIKVVKPQEFNLVGTQQNVVTFTGSPKDGYTLRFRVSPSSNKNGWTIKYPYYKKPTFFLLPDDPSLSGDVGDQETEMYAPEYLGHRVVSELHKSDTNTSAYTTSLQEAEEKLKEMEIRQIQRTFGQQVIEDPMGYSGVWGE